MSGKHPIGKLAPRGFLDATTDRATITRWWQEYPGANIGIATGEISGISVLDIDPRNGGYFNSQFPPTLKIRTGGGGIHLYYKYKKGLPKTMGVGFDIKSDGGYVVAPPSNHALGMYVLDSEIELDEFPYTDVPKAAIPHRGGVIETDHERARVQSAIASVNPDERDTWLTVGMALHSSGWDDSYDIWGAWSKQSSKYDAEDQRRVWASFAGDGTGLGTLFHLAKAGGWHLVPEDESPPLEVYAEYDAPTEGRPILGTNAYYGIAGEITRSIEPITESDPAAILIQTLVLFGAMVGRDVYYPVEASRHHGNLFCLLVGNTGKARKGTSLDQVLSIFSLCEHNARHISGLSTGEGLKYQVRDPSEVTDKRGKIERDEGIADKRLVVVEPEFGSIMKVASRQGATISTTIRNAWDTGNLATLTRVDPIRVTGAHIAIIGHITEGELVAGLSDIEAKNGFINRFLLVAVRRSKSLPDGGGMLELNVRHEFARRIARAAGKIPNGKINMNAQAKAIWKEVYPDISQGQDGLIGEVTARAEAHVVRIAMIYALLDERTQIHGPHLTAALAVWHYCAGSAGRVFGNGLQETTRWKDGDEVTRKIMSWIKDAPKGLSRNDLRDLFCRNKSSEEIERSIQVLLHIHKITATKEQSGGRPKTIYRAASRGTCPIG